MPRGVFTRKTATERMSALGTSKLVAEVQAPEKADPLPPAAPVVQEPTPYYHTKRINIDTVGFDELKLYANTIGILKRDIDSLTEARLRQNCKARVFQMMED